MNAHAYFVSRIYDLLLAAGLAVWQELTVGMVERRKLTRRVLVLASNGEPVSLFSPGDLCDLLGM